MKKIIIIDGNALVHRAFHALPALVSPKGIVTNAVYGFTSILLRIIKDLKPDYIAATFDLAGPTFRHEEFEDYKAHRKKAPQELYDQIPLVKEILASFGIPVFEKQSYEADDVIATIATRAKKEKDLQVIIATGDLDTLQLVDGEKVVVFTLRKGMSDTVIYNEKSVEERYGLKPNQLNDYRGLKGDPSDNIPGVPGVGEKTAGDLIKKFKSLEGLYEYLEKFKIQITNDKSNPKSKTPKTEETGVSQKLAEKLLENKDQAFFSKQLSIVVCDLEIDFSIEKTDWRKNLDFSAIQKDFLDLGFSSLLKRLADIGVTQQESIFELNPSKDIAPVAVSKDKTPKKYIFVISSNDAEVDEAMANTNLTVVGHGLKKFFKVALAAGKQIENKIFDTEIAAYLLSPDRKEYEFDQVYYSEFGKMSISKVPTENELTALKNHLEPKIESSMLSKLFNEIEMPLIKILAEMEVNGIKVDVDGLAILQKATDKELGILEAKIYKISGSEFNINSPQQLSEILFNKLNLKGKVRRTGGGALSTAASELEKLREESPIIDPILDYRELQKLKTTYIDPFPTLVARDGRVHTTYNQTGTATGRLASQEPNLQNIPIRTEIGQEFRKSFIAEKGKKLLSLDYSQIDLRVVAHIAQDEKMIEAFRNGEDIHTKTAAEVFEVSPDKVTKEMRNQAKVLNFGIIYGMGSLAFARSAGVDRQRAREFITKYLSEFSGVAKYMEKMKKKAHDDGYVETLFGRKRQILDIYSTMPQIQSQAERMAINHPIQGTAADLVKMAMIKVDDFLHKNFKEEDAKVLLQVHDELVCEVSEKIMVKLAGEIKEIMESIYKLDVPLVVDAKVGDNWAEMKKI